MAMQPIHSSPSLNRAENQQNKWGQKAELPDIFEVANPIARSPQPAPADAAAKSSSAFRTTIDRPEAMGSAKTVNWQTSATYSNKGTMEAKSKPQDGDLLGALDQAIASKKPISDETKAKLFVDANDDPGPFLEGLSEITGLSEAQIIAAMINMPPGQAGAAGMAVKLAKLTGESSDAFLSNICYFTKHQESMLQQVVNGILESGEDEDDDKKVDEAKKANEAKKAEGSQKSGGSSEGKLEGVKAASEPYDPEKLKLNEAGAKFKSINIMV